MKSKLSEILRMCGIKYPVKYGRTPPKGWEARARFEHGQPVEIILTRKPDPIREIDEFPI